MTRGTAEQQGKDTLAVRATGEPQDQNRNRDWLQVKANTLSKLLQSEDFRGSESSSKMQLKFLSRQSSGWKSTGRASRLTQRMHGHAAGLFFDIPMIFSGRPVPAQGAQCSEPGFAPWNLLQLSAFLNSQNCLEAHKFSSKFMTGKIQFLTVFLKNEIRLYLTPYKNLFQVAEGLKGERQNYKTFRRQYRRHPL